MIQSVNRVGALMQKQNSITKLFEDVVIRLQLTLRLHVLFPESNEIYKLFIYASRDIQDDQAYNPIYEIKNNVELNEIFILRNKPSFPDFIHFWLFVEGHDEDGCEIQTLLCCAYIPTKHLKTPIKIELKDVEHHTQAVLSIRIGNSIIVNESTISEVLPREKTKMVQWMDQINSIYDLHQRNDDAYFIYVDTHIGRLPILSFVVLSNQIRQKQDRALQWLRWLVMITLQRFNWTIDELLEYENDWGEFICEMALWQIRSRLYLKDSIRAGIRKKVGTDQWCRFGCFPNPDKSAGDCEDFAELLLEFFYMFKHITIDSDSDKEIVLYRLQQYLRQYTQCLILGQLNTEDGYVSHAYVALLDSNWLTEQIDHASTKSRKLKTHEDYLPALILEGTNYTESTWSTKTIKSQSRQYIKTSQYNRIFDCLSISNQKSKWERILRFKTPVNVINIQKTYGKAYVLMTSDYVSPRTKQIEALQCLIRRTDQSSPKLGVDHSSLAMYDLNVELIVALRLTLTDMQLLQLNLKELPFSKFPDIPSDYNHLPKSISDFSKYDIWSFDLRYLDYKTNKSTIQRLMKEFCQLLKIEGKPKIYYTKINVARQLRICNIMICDPLINN